MQVWNLSNVASMDVLSINKLRKRISRWAPTVSTGTKSWYTILWSKGTSSPPSMLLDSAPPVLLEKNHTPKKKGWNYKSLGSHPCEDLKCLEVTKVFATLESDEPCVPAEGSFKSSLKWWIPSKWAVSPVIGSCRVTYFGVSKKTSETHGVSAVYRGPHHCIYN